MERASGVLMHITSLPGKYGAGVFGKEAKYFIDFLADSGFKYWQTLPLVMTDECNSPYKSYSAFAGNPYFVDPETLCSDGLLTENELSGAAVTDEYRCDYEKLNRERKTLLANAASRADKTLRKKTERFISENPEIEKFCVFMARKAANGEKPWYDWTCDKTDADELFLWQFIQYEFFTQWSDIKNTPMKKELKSSGIFRYMWRMTAVTFGQIRSSLTSTRISIPQMSRDVRPIIFHVTDSCGEIRFTIGRI